MSEAIDISSAVKAGLSKAEQVARRPQPLLIDMDDWDESDIAPRPWVAPGLLLRGAVTVVVGEPAAGKSMLMVGWATSLVLGETYGRMKPRQPCTVVTYNTEDDRDEQRRRFSAALRSVGKYPSDVRDNLIRVSTDTIGTLLTTAENKSMCATDAMEQLEALLDEHRPDVLILDPLVELHEAEENDNTAVRAVMAHFRSLAIRHDMAVVLLHHTRKGSAGVAGSPDIARGASSIIGAARVVITVSVMTEQEADSFSIPPDHRRFFSRVDGAKINAAPIGKEEWFERRAYELTNGDQVAAMLPWAPPEDTIGLEQRVAIESDLAKGTPLAPWSPRITTDDRSARAVFERHGVSSKTAQKKLLDELKAAGWEVADYRKPNRVPAKGLRSPSGAPQHVDWVVIGEEE